MEKEPDVTTQLQSDFDKRITREIAQAHASGYAIGYAEAASGSLFFFLLVAGAVIVYLLWSNRHGSN